MLFKIVLSDKVRQHDKLQIVHKMKPQVRINAIGIVIALDKVLYKPKLYVSEDASLYITCIVYNLHCI